MRNKYYIIDMKRVQEVSYYIYEKGIVLHIYTEIHVIYYIYTIKHLDIVLHISF